MFIPHVSSYSMYFTYLRTYQATANIDDVLYLLQDLYPEVEPKRFDSQRQVLISTSSVLHHCRRLIYISQRMLIVSTSAYESWNYYPGSYPMLGPLGVTPSLHDAHAQVIRHI